MKKSAMPCDENAVELPDLELPVLSGAARRPPVLSMDQYLAWNTMTEFEPMPPSTLEERCQAPFEL